MPPSVTQRGDQGSSSAAIGGNLTATPGDNPVSVHLEVSRGASTDPTFPATMAVAGVDLDLLDDLVYKATGTERIGIAVYRGYGAWSGTVWSITLGYADSGWRLDALELVDADQGEPIPAGQVASAASLIDDGQTLSASLPSAPASSSRCVACIGRNAAATGDLATRASWTQIDDDAHSTPSTELKSDWRSDAAEQTGSVTGNAGIANLATGIIVYEVAEATPSGILVARAGVVGL